MKTIEKYLNEMTIKTQKLINEQKEKYIQAWLAETGLMPTECTLCHTHIYKDNNLIFKIWMEKHTSRVGGGFFRLSKKRSLRIKK